MVEESFAIERLKELEEMLNSFARGEYLSHMQGEESVFLHTRQCPFRSNLFPSRVNAPNQGL